jgi:hypothetical protein
MAIKTFSVGEVLTASDTNTYLANSGLVYVTSTTIGSAVTSVTVSNCFSSTYDSYRVIITGGVGSQAAGCTLKLGSTATGYYTGGIGLSYAGATTTGNGNNSAFFVLAGLVTTDSIIADFELYGPNLAKRTYYKTAYIYGAPAGGGDVMHGGGYLNDTTAYTAFTFGPTAGTTMTGGTVTVYGYRKA